MSRIIEVAPGAFAHMPLLGPPEELYWWLAVALGAVQLAWFDAQRRVN